MMTNASQHYALKRPNNDVHGSDGDMVVLCSDGKEDCWTIVKRKHRGCGQGFRHVRDIECCSLVGDMKNNKRGEVIDCFVTGIELQALVMPAGPNIPPYCDAEIETERMKVVVVCCNSRSTKTDDRREDEKLR
jgi:hypothetical protein